MIFGGTGTRIGPPAQGDNVASGEQGIAGYFILMWNGYALFSGEARLVKAAE